MIKCILDQDKVLRISLTCTILGGNNRQLVRYSHVCDAGMTKVIFQHFNNSMTINYTYPSGVNLLPTTGSSFRPFFAHSSNNIITSFLFPRSYLSAVLSVTFEAADLSSSPSSTNYTSETAALLHSKFSTLIGTCTICGIFWLPVKGKGSCV